jgi:peroxiredoxin Q/BCP
MLKEGDKAPEFELQDDTGKTVKLSDFKGQKVILYFYPKDDTPGCTQEACDLRDRSKQVQKQGAVVLGVSPDSVESHQKFKKKFELPFRLLADPGSKVCQLYGVWKEKSMYGRTYMGVERTTCLIDEKGKIARFFPKVKVEGHADELLAQLSSIPA